MLIEIRANWWLSFYNFHIKVIKNNFKKVFWNIIYFYRKKKMLFNSREFIWKFCAIPVQCKKSLQLKHAYVSFFKVIRMKWKTNVTFWMQNVNLMLYYNYKNYKKYFFTTNNILLPSKFFYSIQFQMPKHGMGYTRARI